MKTSVVIAVHNGEKYIETQVRSILNQSTTIDEFVVVDDNSSDSSISIVSKLLTGQNFELVRNLENLGVIRSFEIGIKKASNPICFLCDQDDIWHSNKVETFKNEFLAGAHFVFSDADLIDENGSVLPSSFIKKLNLSAKDRSFVQCQKLDQLLPKMNVVCGACCAFLKEKIPPAAFPLVYNEQHFLHDRQLANLFACQNADRINFANKKLSAYRIHQDQVMGFNKKGKTSISSKQEYVEHEKKLIQLTLDRIENDHFRRSYNFWNTRSKLKDMSFLKKLFTILSFSIEGTYRSNCRNPTREAFSDLKL